MYLIMQNFEFGFNKVSRIIKSLEKQKIISKPKKRKRKVLVSLEELKTKFKWLKTKEY